MTESQLSPEVEAFVLNRSLPGSKESLFFFDPLLSPSEFKLEVLEWLQEEPPFFPASSPSSIEGSTSDEIHEFNQFFTSAISQPLNVSTPPPPMEEPGSSCNIANIDYLEAMPYDFKYSNQENVYVEPLRDVYSNEYTSYPQMLSPLPPSAYVTPSVPLQYVDQSTTPSLPVQYGSPSSGAVGFRRQPLRAVQHKASTSPKVCTNCNTTTTSMWRWSSEGQRECNACNIYRYRNGETRPVALRRDKIRTRQRNRRHPIVACSDASSSIF